MTFYRDFCLPIEAQNMGEKRAATTSKDDQPYIFKTTNIISPNLKVWINIHSAFMKKHCFQIWLFLLNSSKNRQKSPEIQKIENQFFDVSHVVLDRDLFANYITRSILYILKISGHFWSFLVLAARHRVDIQISGIGRK